MNQAFIAHRHVLRILIVLTGGSGPYRFELTSVSIRLAIKYVKGYHSIVVRAGESVQGVFSKREQYLGDVEHI